MTIIVCAILAATVFTLGVLVGTTVRANAADRRRRRRAASRRTHVTRFPDLVDA